MLGSARARRKQSLAVSSLLVSSPAHSGDPSGAK